MPVNYSTLNLKGLLPIATRKPVSKNDEEDADRITTQESNAGEDFIVSFCLRHIELAEMVWLSQFFFMAATVTQVVSFCVTNHLKVVKSV